MENALGVVVDAISEDFEMSIPAARLPLGTNGEPPLAPVFPRRPKRRLRITAETVVDSVLTRFDQIMQDRDRAAWMTARLNRYAKFRGWNPDRAWPGGDPRSNAHLPLMMMAELRGNAGLHNVVMTRRPNIVAEATNRAHQPREEKITALIDAQMYVEGGPALAERKMSDAISAFFQDGNWVAFTPWVRVREDVETVHRRPPVPEMMLPEAYLQALLVGVVDPESGAPIREGLFPADAQVDLDPARPNRVRLTYRRAATDEITTAQVEVFSEEDDVAAGEHLVLQVRSTETLFDGPVLENLSISQVFVPTRCTNLQPPAPWNTSGAPYVFVKPRYRLDEIRRLKADGTFNWLTEQDLEKIIAGAKAAAGIPAPVKDDEQLEVQKDAMEGRAHEEPDTKYEEDVGHLSVPALMCFDRWDVDGDGRSEDVYWIVFPDAKVLAEARRLTEKWPATRPYRPLAEACAIPVPGRYYGISLLELGEALYDLIKGTFDLSYDSAVVATIPWFFYAASAQFRAETIHLAPGEGYPVPGNPRETVWFPNLPARDQTWAFNLIGLALSFFDRLMSQGAAQQGQVPSGKASAFRTFGTTMALMNQADVRADQMLIRFFSGLAQVAQNFHRMNRKLLPPGKEIRVVGWDGAREQAYTVINSAAEIDAEVEFGFRPDFLQANPDALAAALESMLAVVGTPLAFQLGITDPQLFYQAVRDFARARRLDHKNYVKPPTADGAPILAEEVIGMITSGGVPFGVPLEAPAEHLRKLWEFLAATVKVGDAEAPVVASWTQGQMGVLKAWMAEVGRRLQIAQNAAAAGQFQQGMAGGGMQGGGGVPTTVAEPSPMDALAAPMQRQPNEEAP